MSKFLGGVLLGLSSRFRQEGGVIGNPHLVKPARFGALNHEVKLL